MTRFAPLFTLAVNHEYFEGPCRDVGYLIPADTARMVAGARTIAREMDGILHVLYETDDAGDPLITAGGARLRIGLVPPPGGLGAVTMEAPGFDGTVAFYHNDSDPDDLDQPLGVTIVPTLVGFQPELAARPVTVQIQALDGTVLFETTLTTATRLPTASFDLTALPPAAYTVLEKYPGGTERSRSVYLDTNLAAERVFGVVELEIDEAWYDDPPEFLVELDAREDALRYYVVGTKYSAADMAALTIKDTGFTEDGRSEVKFTKLSPNPSGEFAASELTVPMLAGANARVVLFRSQGLVARRAAGRRKVQLLKGPEVLIANLPQPAADRANADVVIHLSKP
jgi:hypothetical protein